MTARTSAQTAVEPRTLARRGVDAGECVVSVREPFCWRGCDGHGWQHLPTQWCPADDYDDESVSGSTETNGGTE